MIFRNKIIKEKVLSWFNRHSCVEFGENTYLRMGVSIIDKEGYKYILNSTNVQKDTRVLNGKQDKAYGKKWIYKTEYKQLA